MKELETKRYHECSSMATLLLASRTLGIVAKDSRELGNGESEGRREEIQGLEVPLLTGPAHEKTQWQGLFSVGPTAGNCSD
jgi:hypothetical protein